MEVTTAGSCFISGQFKCGSVGEGKAGHWWRRSLHTEQELAGFGKVINTYTQTHTAISNRQDLGIYVAYGLQYCTVSQLSFSSLIGRTKKPPVSMLMTDYA